jgi:hypothetical protein
MKYPPNSEGSRARDKHHLGLYCTERDVPELTEIPRHRPEPSEQGRSVFELAGDEMDDLALALHLARHLYGPHPEHDAALTLEEAATLSRPVSSSRVRNTTPVAVPGRWRVMTSPAACVLRPWVSPTTSRADWKERRVSAGRRGAGGWRRRARSRLP